MSRNDADLWLRLPRSIRVSLRRARIALDPVFGPFVSPSSAAVPSRWMSWALRRIPSLPRRVRRVHPSPPWPSPNVETPAELRTVAGIWRDRAAEGKAFEERPLHQYFFVHPENLPRAMKHGWHFVLPAAPAMARALARVPRLAGARRAKGAAGTAAATTTTPVESRQRTADIRAEARRLGISAVGFAAYDAKYTLAEYAGTHDEGSVIVCLLEQDWSATQTAPSARAERAAFMAYAGLTERLVALAEFVERGGARAYPHPFVGETMAIHYGVQAGLGQLGMNGQLLAPQAGSRARLAIITTNATLVHDEPVDFGIHKICDDCQACVRRCPVGAIPNRRREYRGVTKAKIKTERCFPVVVSAEGCAVCMKVCPIQRYGLEAVQQHYSATGGQILGKETDELEGYDWPIDGRHYGPGEKPDADARRRLLNPPHWHPVDPQRTTPLPVVDRPGEG
jgi:epoxyqueuosine reductase